MIVIDEFADVKLTKKLEIFKDEPDLTKCIYLHLMDKPSIDGLKDKIIKSAQQHIFSHDLQLYLCDDGDVFILSPSVFNKPANEFILEIAAYLNTVVNSDFVEFYEIEGHINKLLFVLEQKQEKRRKGEEAIYQEKERQRTIQKRQEILNGGTLGKKGDIGGKRIGRSSPQFMIIEDDAFSRRLVENVLQKQYPLTALGSAELAIATYINLAPDILFLDINLPDVTGHELLEKIIAIDPDAYIIMLSGNADQTNIMKAMSLGAKGFIAKPFTREKLFQYISRCPSIKN